VLTAECFFLQFSERLLNVLYRIPQDDRSAMRTRHGMVGFRESASSQSILFCSSGMLTLMAAWQAMEAAMRHEFFQVQRLLFARDLIEQFVEHVLDRGRIYARRSNLHRDAARAEGLSFESIVLQFVGDLGKDGLLRWRQLKNNRYEQALAFDFLRCALL